MKNWYEIDNVAELDTPSLAVFPARIKENIQILKELVPAVERQRPHVKTNKYAEVSQLMMDAGITKFKCAIIAEAEMLATLGAPDVLLAYQPVRPRNSRLIRLIKNFPSTKFSCLLDNEVTAKELAAKANEQGVVVNVFLDLNVGMNRTGIVPEKALPLFIICRSLVDITPIGLHAYYGHNRDSDIGIRTTGADEGYARVEKLQCTIFRTNRNFAYDCYKRKHNYFYPCQKRTCRV